jgi:hypothetical protein
MDPTLTIIQEVCDFDIMKGSRPSCVTPALHASSQSGVMVKTFWNKKKQTEWGQKGPYTEGTVTVNQ